VIDKQAGACADKVDDWLWFDHGATGEAEALAEARTICGPCPIRAACLAYATEHKLEGIWAGTTEAMRSGKTWSVTCRNNHDLTAPNARGYRGQCKACRAERDAKYQDTEAAS